MGVSRWRWPNSDIHSQIDHFGLVYDMIYQFHGMEAKNYKFSIFYQQLMSSIRGPRWCQYSTEKCLLDSHLPFVYIVILSIFPIWRIGRQIRGPKLLKYCFGYWKLLFESSLSSVFWNPTLLYGPILLVFLINVPPYSVISHSSVIWNSRVRSCGIHRRASSWEDLKIPINKTRLRITFFESRSDLPGANELILLYACKVRGWSHYGLTPYTVRQFWFGLLPFRLRPF